ncbi:MAG: twin-arginine translocation signal domain-containing protein [Rhodobacteraceae bacterium]|jgi:hypothetical protein|nr:twin-arginine translocation signal domain-containing protein [Paracoccaceae bacterium]
MGKRTEAADESRRNFLKLASVAAPAVVAGASLGADPVDAAAAKPVSGLQDTDHIRTYYALARF